MRGNCGKKNLFGKDLPCPDHGPAAEPEDRDLLVNVCGEKFAEGLSCCTSAQLETLRENLNQAENIISTCPACRNNFRSFFCQFTCSPDQATFLNVTHTQTTTTGKEAVKSVDFQVSRTFGEGFYDSCKNVQVGATNGYAMDLIGGGAKDYHGFFKFLGDEKALGSPFQINFPHDSIPELAPLDLKPRNCADNDLGSRCTCVDCPDVCLALPDVPAPGQGPTCHVGSLSCLSFVLTLAYCIAVAAVIATYFARRSIQRRKERTYERVALSADTASTLSPRSHPRALVGAGSLAPYMDGEDTQETRHLGRGASLLDPIDTLQPRQYALNSILRRHFYRLGLFAASSPWLVFAMVFAVVGLLNIGWTAFAVETDPVRLWVSPTSESRLQKEYFDEHFGPFYRTEQIFLTAPAAAESNGEATSFDPVLTWSHLQYWSNVEKEIRTLRSHPNGYQLSDVCFKPAGEEGACVVQSVMGWFGNDLDDYSEDTWAERVTQCANAPVECLPDFQQPLTPNFVLGGVPTTGEGTSDYVNAEALVVNIVVSDSLDKDVQAKAMEWETALRNLLASLSEAAPVEAGLRVAYSTGVSLEEEINKSTNTDVKIVVLSYLAMFVYIALTLGRSTPGSDHEGVISSIANWVRNFPKLFRSSRTSLPEDPHNEPTIFPRLPRGLFVNTKISLGLFGISLVVLSVSTSVGFFSLLGVKVTLIIAEVIPFLVLAVGVDNVFILVHELDRQNHLHAVSSSLSPHPAAPAMSPTASHRSPFQSTQSDMDMDVASMATYLTPEERVARTLAKMGPSILLSTVTETLAFALGALVPMPAVRNFALYAAGSVFLNAVLQVTVFISALTLDLRRVEAHRVDCFPCIRLPPKIALVDAPNGSGLGTLARLIRHYYAPFLLRPVVKIGVLLTFAGIFVLSVISMQHIQLGLDQRLALPSDSYLVSYFDHLDKYLDVGPPVYFVSYDVDTTQREGQQALCGRFSTCQDRSLTNLLEAERKRPESSFISEPTASWIDDFLNWLDPAKESCCRLRKRPEGSKIFCGERDSPRACRPCFEGREPAWNITMTGFPEDEEFMDYLRQWLISPTTEECPLAGKASFGTALSLGDEGEEGPGVVASHFRTFHSPLKSQNDFINAFAAAHRVADEISEHTGTKVFPYSLFYVFFDQYAHIVAITQEVLGLGLASVLIVTALMLGSWRTGSIVTGVVALTVVTVMGVMAVWGISLNAISLVNLVISLGIAVEFCAHVARAFMSAGSSLPMDHPGGQKERDERMWTALIDVGPSVLSGITFTKLIGMSVLALTRSRLLEIYYFRMWLTLIISGALHGLVLLPVVLSIAGGAGFPQQEADEEWMSHAIRNDYEYAPFLADTDSLGSD